MTAIEHKMTDDEYEEMLNEIYEPVSVCGYIHDQGTLLKRIDPIAFRCGKSECENQWECSDCQCVYDTEREAENCCSAIVECEMCGTKFVQGNEHCENQFWMKTEPECFKETMGNDDAVEELANRFCCWECAEDDNDNLNSHLGEAE